MILYLPIIAEYRVLVETSYCFKKKRTVAKTLPHEKIVLAPKWMTNRVLEGNKAMVWVISTQMGNLTHDIFHFA
jgi:hypothetical protein